MLSPMRLIVILVLALLSAALSGQQVYRSVGPDGEVIFSDQGSTGAEKIKVAPLPTYEAPPKRSTQANAPPRSQAYTSFELVSPTDNQTLRDGGGQVSVTVSLQPPLRGTDSIDVIYDGRFIGPDKALSRVLGNIERGSHSVQPSSSMVAAASWRVPRP